MAVLRELRRRARQIAPPVLGACLVAYFAYHAVQGDRGIIAWLVLNQQIREAETVAAAGAAERATLEHRVALLGPAGLDPDLLDERARIMLGLVQGDELVILLDGSDPQP
ncbi:MAG: septum formation initiator family protein [Dongiaceae bacterium]